MKHWKENAFVGVTHAIGGLGLGFLLSAYWGIGGVMWGWVLVILAALMHVYIWMM